MLTDIPTSSIVLPSLSSRVKVTDPEPPFSPAYSPVIFSGINRSFQLLPQLQDISPLLLHLGAILWSQRTITIRVSPSVSSRLASLAFSRRNSLLPATVTLTTRFLPLFFSLMVITAEPAVPSPVILTGIFEPGPVRGDAVAMYLLLVLTVIADFFSDFITIVWLSFLFSLREALLTVK